MDTQLENNYPHNIDLILQLIINNGYFGLKDLYNICKIDTFLNSLSKKYIKKYYDILQKCSVIQIETQVKYHSWGDRTYINDAMTIHNVNNNLFNKLNNDEMAIYYSYFIFKYHNFHKVDVYSKYWTCVLYENGFIKSLSYIHNNISNTDIIMKIKIHYSYIIYRNYPKKLNYWGTNITFENNKGRVISPNFVNLKLLDKLIINNNYQRIKSKTIVN